MSRVANSATQKDIKKSKKSDISKIAATEEQMIYANILDIGMKIGLTGIVISFIIYVFGIIPPKIPLANVSNFWAMKSHDYLEAANIKAGWTWLSMYKYSDFINFYPIAFLSGLTIACYLAIIPVLIRKKDTIYVILALLEVLILLGAASGILGGGGH